MFGWGNKNKQDVCLLSETNRMIDEKLDAGTIHAESPDTAEAWGLDAKQQCKDEKTGRYIQFISSLSCDPIVIYKNPDTAPVKANTSLISSQTEDQEMTYIDYGKKKDGRLIWVGVCLAMFALTLCIIAYMVVVK